MTTVDSLRVTRGPEAGAIETFLAMQEEGEAGRITSILLSQSQVPSVVAALVTTAAERLTGPAREAMAFACVGAAEQALDEHRQRRRPR